LLPDAKVCLQPVNKKGKELHSKSGPAIIKITIENTYCIGFEIASILKKYVHGITALIHFCNYM